MEIILRLCIVHKTLMVLVSMLICDFNCFTPYKLANITNDFWDNLKTVNDRKKDEQRNVKLPN